MSKIRFLQKESEKIRVVFGYQIRNLIKNMIATES